MPKFHDLIASGILTATVFPCAVMCGVEGSAAGERPAVLAPATFGPQPVGAAAMKLDHLPYLQQAKMFQWSSFSHPSANDDDFYYPDPHADGFNVFIDIKGPGALNHWWSTGGMSGPVRLRFYFDDEREPRLATTIADWCNRRSPLNRSSANVHFVPMPFRTRCVVSTDGPRGEEFHHMYAYTYPAAEGIRTFTGKEDLSEVEAMWNNVGADPKSTAGNRTLSGKIAIPKGRTATLCDRKGQETIVSLKVKPKPAQKELLANLWITAYWDGRKTPQIAAPLSYFFGGADHGEDKISHALPVGMSVDGPWYFYFPMPYWTSARIEIENRAQLDCDELVYEIQYKPCAEANYPKEQCGYLHAHFAAGNAEGPENFSVLEAEGAGHIVGVVKGPGVLGENDEMVYVDDNLTPQSWGTGGEDYPLFCYGMRTEGYPMWGGWSDWRYYRYHVSDTINFHKKIQFGFEHGEDHPRGWLKPNTARMHIESLCLYYLNPVPNLMLTDEVDVGNSVSEAQHAYRVKGESWSGKARHAYQGNETVLIEDDGRAFSGHSEFAVKLPPQNNGARLRRRMVMKGIQEARVFVDGTEVKESRFYSPINYRPRNGFYDTNQLWRDLDFEIPARYTNGRESITLRIEHVPSPLPRRSDWTEFHYWVYSYTRRIAPP
jgi:hypothetical protein